MRRICRYFFLFALLLSGVAYTLKSYPVIKLSAVNITGTYRIRREDLPLQSGANIFSIDQPRLLNSVAANAFVQSASVKIDHRGDLTLVIEEKIAAGYVYLDQLYALTSRAELIPVDLVDTVMALPVIRGLNIKDYHLFDRPSDPALWASLKLIQTVKEKFSGSFNSLSEVVVTSAGLTAIVEPGSIVANMGWGNYEQKWQRLQQVLAVNKNPGLDLDLRFADMTIVKSRVVYREVNNGI